MLVWPTEGKSYRYQSLCPKKTKQGSKTVNASSCSDDWWSLCGILAALLNGPSQQHWGSTNWE